MAACGHLLRPGFGADPRDQCLRLGRRLQLVLPLQLPGKRLVGAHSRDPLAQTLQQENQATEPRLVGGLQSDRPARCLHCAGAIPASLPRIGQCPGRPSRALPEPAEVVPSRVNEPEIERSSDRPASNPNTPIPEEKPSILQRTPQS